MDTYLKNVDQMSFRMIENDTIISALLYFLRSKNVSVVQGQNFQLVITIGFPLRMICNVLNLSL